MDFQQLILQRQSVRKFDKERPIEREKLMRILEAGRLAPSASNTQPWTFVVADEPGLVLQISKAMGITKLHSFNKFAINARLHIALVIEKPKLITQIGASLQKIDYPLIDIGIAAEHMCLQAAEDGIGSCMVGWFDEKKIKELLDIPKNKTIGLMIPFGYPVADYPLRKKIRKPLDKIVRWNKY
jgi:nitroreductase